MAGNGKKVLLHACCGPCSIMCIQSLRDEGYDVTGYFANPNIHPVSEYFRRREAMEQVAEQMDLPMLWQDDVYDLPGWLKMVHDLGIADNQGCARCGYCYRIGGDEFCVLLKDEESEARCAKTLQALLAERRKVFAILPTVSLGSAAFSGEDVVAVKDRADRALYCAKKEQKARAAAEKHGDDSERTA